MSRIGTVHDVADVYLPPKWVGDGPKSGGYNYQLKSIAEPARRLGMWRLDFFDSSQGDLNKIKTFALK